jgi:hypothetical protein
MKRWTASRHYQDEWRGIGSESCGDSVMRGVICFLTLTTMSGAPELLLVAALQRLARARRNPKSRRSGIC